MGEGGRFEGKSGAAQLIREGEPSKRPSGQQKKDYKVCKGFPPSRISEAIGIGKEIKGKTKKGGNVGSQGFRKIPAESPVLNRGEELGRECEKKRTRETSGKRQCKQVGGMTGPAMKGDFLKA